MVGTGVRRWVIATGILLASAVGASEPGSTGLASWASRRTDLLMPMVLKPPFRGLAPSPGIYARYLDIEGLPPDAMRVIEIGALWGPMRVLPIPGDPIGGPRMLLGRMQIDQTIQWGFNVRLVRVMVAF